MTEIHLNINNAFDSETLLNLFPRGKEYEFTGKQVFRRKTRIRCKCGDFMVHNGHDLARKKGFGEVKIGKQLCKSCGNQYHEDKSFWKDLIYQWQDAMTSLFMLLRDGQASWQVISKMTRFLVPCSKDKARYMFNQEIEQFEFPQKNCAIVHYDEQHPKKGRHQKFRLTLLDQETKQPIADDLCDDKNSQTIEAFLRKHLDASKPIVLITDCDRAYPPIFKEIWGKKVIHQKCLLHLNKLIVNEFENSRSLMQEYNKYRLLNIFYNRSKELKFLEQKMKKLEVKHFESDAEKHSWQLKKVSEFKNFVHELENERRRNRKNLSIRKLDDAEKQFRRLRAEELLFSKKTRERLWKIAEDWKYFTAFYHIKGCPATNNALENYYSTSLKTQQKKQLRSDAGLRNHMKLAARKRAGNFAKPKKTLLQIYGLIRLIAT